MDVRTYIENEIKKKKELRTATIVAATDVSRQYVNRMLRELVQEGKLIRIGKSNRARYVLAEKRAIENTKLKETLFTKTFANKGIEEDQVLNQIRQQTGILLSLPENVEKIIDYAFTEMLNNAIEHSLSKEISVKMQRRKEGIRFTVVDRGIGIFNNIMKKKKFATELEAIQDLLKGKQTTIPDRHSGEGIFFTSKLAEKFSIKSFSKTLLYDNIINDVFLSDSTSLKGTRVDFWVPVSSQINISDVFRQYTGDEFEFSTTEVAVALYKAGTPYISRSQARRITSGLEKFNTIILDFKNMDTIGQAFADEIFRVWKNRHPSKEIVVRNAGENVQFMIDHVTR